MGTETVERELVRDLELLGARFSDEKFCDELYRALARNKWAKQGLEGHVALSFGRAEGLINDLRAQLGEQPLTLAQTGGEGEVDATIDRELAGRGWHASPLDTSANDPGHSSQPQAPPHQSSEPPEWETEAHAEAEAERQSGR